MSALAEDLAAAETAVVESEVAVAAARKAEVEALVAGDHTGAGERRKRLGSALATLDAALGKLDLLREAAALASDRDAKAQHHAEVERRFASMRHQRQDLDRIESAIAETLVRLGRLAADRHAAGTALVSTCRWLRDGLGEQTAVERGVDGLGLATPEFLVKLANDLHRDIGAAVGARTQPVAHADLRIPIFTASTN